MTKQEYLICLMAQRSRVPCRGRGCHIEGRGSRVTFFFSKNLFWWRGGAVEKLRDIHKENVMLLLLLLLLLFTVKQYVDSRMRLKVKNLLPSCEGRQVVPNKNVIELGQGHRTTVFCKISVREAKMAYNFLLLEEG